jgi:sugar lactone lactonase YvrE
VLEHILQVGNILGECVLWHSRHNALWWTDIQASRLQRYDWTTGALQTLEAPERIGSFGFVTASDSLICVTTAREGLDDSRLYDEPHAGDVFLYRVGTQGLPESEYRA